MSHLSAGRAQGFKQTVSCLWAWNTTKPIDLNEMCMGERVALRVCKAEPWIRGWWDENALLVKWFGAFAAVMTGYIAGGYIAIWLGIRLSEGVAK